MKRYIPVVLLLLFLLFPPSTVSAVYDPFSAPNNTFGVHILDPSEIFDAVKLVNTAGGSWGYLTVPIRSDDRNRYKWQQFFRKCSELKIIPIVRLTTYFTGVNWTTPTSNDLVDFANFLNDMPWPIKNRYIILFNEPNHANEWGGRVDPGQYLSLILSAREIFKTRSDDFFLLSAGLDMSAPNNSTSMDALDFYRRMFLLDVDWPKEIDGFSFHAYPNPGFSAAPSATGRFNIGSYRYELRLINKFYPSQKPYIISETGSVFPDKYYRPAIKYFFSDPEIFAVTPFLLFAGEGNFSRFSLLDKNYSPTSAHRYLSSIPKISGSPLLSDPEDRLYLWLYEMVISP